MTIADAVIVGTTLFSCIFGMVRGITREILGLVSWGASIGVTFSFFPFVRGITRYYVDNPMLSDIIGVTFNFVLFLILFSIVSQLLSNWVQQSALGSVDRSLGCAFGLVRGLVLVCAFEIFAHCFLSRAAYPQAVRDSHFLPLIYQGSDCLFSLIPPSAQTWLRTQQQKYVQEEAQPNVTSNSPESSDTEEDRSKKVGDLAILKPKSPEPPTVTASSKPQKNLPSRRQQEMSRLLSQ